MFEIRGEITPNGARRKEFLPFPRLALSDSSHTSRAKNLHNLY
jgi:hypothetical protein